MSNRDDRLKAITQSVNNDVLGYLSQTEPSNVANDTDNKTDNKKATRRPKNANKKVSKNDTRPTIDELASTIANEILKNGLNKTDNTTITFKIDADLEDYLKNIDKITFIENLKQNNPQSTNKTEYINLLIRQDRIKLLGLRKDASDDVVNTKWIEYKKANNLK
jgi:hypothetical protein